MVSRPAVATENKEWAASGSGIVAKANPETTF